MKRTITYGLLSAALAALALTGCRQESISTPEETDGAVAARFVTSSTRVVNDTEWEGNEVIGISNITTKDAATNNIAYKAGEAGASTKFTAESTKLYLPADKSEVTFAAYYPRLEEVNGTTAAFTIDNGTAQPVLFATGKGTSENPKVAFTFKHKLAKIKLVLTAQEGVDLQKITGVTFRGGITDASLDIHSGTLTAGETKGAISLKSLSKGIFSSYIVPQQVDKAGMSFEIEGEQNWMLKLEKSGIKATAFDENKQYTFQIKLMEDGSVEMVGDNSTIGKPGEGETIDGGDITPDEGDDDEDPTLPTVQKLPFVRDFQADVTSLAPFTEYSVTGEEKWTIDNSEYKNGAKMTGHYGGKEGGDHANEDWLISPALDLSDAAAPELTFEHAIGYQSNVQEEQTAWISTDYVEGAPGSATWEQLTITYPSAEGSWTHETTKVDLSGYKGKANVRIAFKYTCTESGSATWEIFNVSVKEADGTVTPDPTPEPEPTPGESQLLFPGGDFEDFEAFKAKLNNYGLKSYATQGEDAGQGKVLHINGTPSGNDYVFTIENVPCPVENPTKISFKVKGTSAKSISLNVYDDQGGYKPFNLDDVSGDKTITAKDNNQYARGSIDTKGKWVTITLDLSGVAVNTTGAGNFFALKIGKETAWDVMLDDFMIE